MAWLAPLLLSLVLGSDEGLSLDQGPDEGQCLLQTFLERHVADSALAGTEEAGGHYCATSSRAGKVCCAAECGACGGPGCNQRPGGGAHCCFNAIDTEGRACTGPDDTVCVMPRGTFPDSKCQVHRQYNSRQAPVKNCRSDAFPVGSHFCLHGEMFTVAASWNTGGSGATVNIEGSFPSRDFFADGDWLTPRSTCSECKVHRQYNSRQAPVKNCRSDEFPVGSHICLHGEKFTVSASWDTGSSGATVNIEGSFPSRDFFADDDEITPRC